MKNYTIQKQQLLIFWSISFLSFPLLHSCRYNFEMNFSFHLSLDYFPKFFKNLFINSTFNNCNMLPWKKCYSLLTDAPVVRYLRCFSIARINSIAVFQSIRLWKHIAISFFKNDLWFIDKKMEGWNIPMFTHVINSCSRCWTQSSFHILSMVTTINSDLDRCGW